MINHLKQIFYFLGLEMYGSILVTFVEPKERKRIPKKKKCWKTVLLTMLQNFGDFLFVSQVP